MAFRKPIQRAKGSKYNNKKVEYDGCIFDSKKEMQRYIVLADAERSGLISELQKQVRFTLIPAVTEEYVEHLKTKDKLKTRTLQFAITYTADFTYMKDGEYIVEDVKASPKMLPKDYVLKKKMLLVIR